MTDPSLAGDAGSVVSVASSTASAAAATTAGLQQAASTDSASVVGIQNPFSADTAETGMNSNSNNNNHQSATAASLAAQPATTATTTTSAATTAATTNTTSASHTAVPPATPPMTQRRVHQTTPPPQPLPATSNIAPATTPPRPAPAVAVMNPAPPPLPNPPQQPPLPLTNATNNSTALPPAQQQPHQPQAHFDDDENTEPSSSSNPGGMHVHVGGGQHGMALSTESSTAGSSSQGGGSAPHVRPNSIVRFLDKARRSFSNTMSSAILNSNGGGISSSSGGDEEEDDDGLLQDGVLIAGYLQKLGRNGKWQTRWFETDGECLSYYKSEKRTKLLATLDLEKVGDIAVDPADDHDRSFTIQVLDRLYHLRANSRASCKDWVITLHRIKEARLQQGNVQLLNVGNSSHSAHEVKHAQSANPALQLVDLLDPTTDAAVQSAPHHSHNMAPRVVVVANRHRTRAVAESVEWDELMYPPTDGSVTGNDHQYYTTQQADNDEYISTTTSSVGTRVLARWTKHKSSISRVGAKLLKWARSVRNLQCFGDPESDRVQLDRHVHPPGHDDKRKKSSRSAPSVSTTVGEGSTGPSAWIGKETAASVASGKTSVGSNPAMTVTTSPTATTGVVVSGVGGGPVGFDYNKERSMSLGSDSERIIS